MQAYGAVAPSATLRSSDERSSKSNGTFLAVVAGVLVLAFVVGHQAHSTSAHTTNLAAAQAMRAEPQVQMRAEPQVQRQIAAAQRQMGVAKAMGVKTHKLEEEEPAEKPKPKASEGASGSDESIDILPPDHVKGGKGKALESSIEEAFEDKPDSDNDHYIPDHTDKEVHLYIIFFLLLGTIVIYYMWKNKDSK